MSSIRETGEGGGDGAVPVVVYGLLVPLHIVLAGWLSVRYAPTSDEVAHLAAGVRILTTGQFQAYRVNPPLVKSMAAIPVVLQQPRLDWSRVSPDPSVRSEWDVGRDFMRVNGRESLWFFVLSRWMCLPFSVLGLLVCYWWSRDLFGSRSGLLAASLWTFSPNVLGNAALITPDAAAAALGLLSAYAFRHWIRSPQLKTCLIAGVTLGLAQLSKMTWVILYGAFPAVWLISEWLLRNRQRFQHSAAARCAQLCLLLSTSLIVLNAGYLFRGTGQRLADYDFISRTGAAAQEPAGNRFRGTVLGAIPVPLPADYIIGMDIQRRDFEGGWRPLYSYLRGEHRLGGWWYFYLYGMLVKLPVGLWMIGIAATAGMLTVWKNSATDVRCDLVILSVPAAVLFAVVSSQTGFSRSFRYVLPAFGPGFVLISSVWNQRPSSHTPWAARLAGAGLACFTISSLTAYPNSLAYFNELAGGPHNGHRHLLDSNIDWGQDLYLLKAWLDSHPEARPVYLHYCGTCDPWLLGVEHLPFPAVDSRDSPDLPAGIYAISVNHLYGFDSADGPWSYFQRLRPLARTGPSILVYRVESER